MDEAAGNQGFQGLPTSTSGMQVPIASDGVHHAKQNEVAAGGETAAGGGGNNGAANQCLVREQDRFMPIANVIRIMRKVLPTHAKISDDAKETIQECVSEYISFITSEANERCQKEQRKTITAEDVLWAMSKLGFDDYVEPLTIYLQRYRELEGDHRGSIRGEPLAPLKRTASAVDASAAGLYGAAVQAQFHMQALAPYTHAYGVYGDGYYLSMYGSGDGSGSGSSSSQTTPMMHNYDPYAPFK